MSQNAQRFDGRQLAAEEAADGGYDYRSNAGREGLTARAIAEGKSVRRQWAIRMGFKPAYSYCPNGLIALSNKGIKVFEETHPGVIPWNLYKAGPAGQGYYSYNIECTREERDALVEAHARFGGWIAKAAELPVLAKAIGQSVSSRGEGSRRTYVSLWGLAARYPSPQALQRRIFAVQRRAIEVLRAYDGRGCTLRSVMMALSVTGAVGKAAVIAAYRSLTGEGVVKYSEARNALTELHLCKMADSTDGVEVTRSVEPVFQKLGVRVYPYVQKGNSGWKRGFLVLGQGGRTYHHSAGKKGYWPHAELCGKYPECDSALGALACAMQAWTQQKKLERENKQFFSRLQPEGFIPLVYFQDSRDAGNCRDGTIAFMERAGIKTDRAFVPVTALLPFVGEVRVMNTLKLVAQKLERLAA